MNNPLAHLCPRMPWQDRRDRWLPHPVVWREFGGTVLTAVAFLGLVVGFLAVLAWL